MHFKRLSILLICLIFIISPIAGDLFCYAADNTWEAVTTEQQMTQAFMAYCKSRDLTIEGSVADGVTSFTTKAFQDACKGAGIDINTIQAHLKYTTYGNSGLQFLFDATGVSLYNRLFSQFCQDYELEVGEEVDKTIYSGFYYNGCLVYDVTQINANSNKNLILKYGTAFQGINASKIFSTAPYNLSINPFPNTNINIIGTYSSTNNVTLSYVNTNNQTLQQGSINKTNLNPIGEYCYFIVNSNIDTVHFGFINKWATNPDAPSFRYAVYDYVSSNNADTRGCNITVYSPTINNNDYEQNIYTTINNEGDVNNYYGYEEPDPEEPDPDDPDPDDPSGGIPPIWDIGGGEGQATDGNGNTWNITFPDFELPDLNIDWSISGLGDKFPFSIPFDMVALITALNAEPEAPRFTGTVDFGITTWDYDINLSEFDTVASACRIAEILLLVFGLILITRQIIKG